MDIFQRTKEIEMRVEAGDFIRHMTALMIAKGDHEHAAGIFADRYPHSKSRDLIQKSTVAPGMTSDVTWAAPIALPQLQAAFLDYLRPQTVLGRLVGVRRVPFNISFPRATAGVSVQWIGEGKAIAVSDMAFETQEFEFSKLAGLVVISKELAQAKTADAERLIQRDLTQAIAAFTDTAFLDPTLASVSGTSPSSITFGATEITSTGSTAAQVETDMIALFAAITTNLVAPYLIMRPKTALYMATLRTTSGDRLFPALGARGGEIWGVPVLTTANSPTDANSPAESNIVLVDAEQILLAEGGVELDATEHALLQMDTTPDSPPTASSVLQSLWQRNLVGMRVIRYVRWQRATDGAVAYISSVGY